MHFSSSSSLGANALAALYSFEFASKYPTSTVEQTLNMLLLENFLILIEITNYDKDITFSIKSIHFIFHKLMRLNKY